MMPSLLRDLRDSLANPSYWAYSTWLEIVAKYRRSRLGLLWAMVPAIAYIWGMGAFFASMRDVPLAQMVPHVALGTIVFRLLTNTVTESAGVFGGHQSFILDNRIRLTDLLLRTLAKGLFYLVVALPVAAAALWIAGNVHPLGLLTAFATFFLIVLTTMWMSVLIALIGARFSDAQELIGSVMLFAYVLTPIIWFKSDMPPGTLRGDFMRLNPLFHLIEVFRAPVFGEAVEPMSWIYVAVMTVLGCGAALLAYRRYARQVPIWI
jgi:ABC-type polysaccharide/polyol phosphate export permease